MVGAVPQRRWREGDIYHLEHWRAINTAGSLWSRLLTARAWCGREAADEGTGGEGGFNSQGREAFYPSNVCCHNQKYLNYTHCLFMMRNDIHKHPQFPT